jgi:hypothetical protein
VSFEWRLYARDAQGKLQGEIREYKSCKLVPVLSDVGSWSLLLDRRSEIAGLMQQPGWGIVAKRAGSPNTILSGPGTRWRHSGDADRNELAIDGVTDEIWLKRRNAHPSPADSVPPYNTQASDVKTGVTSTVITHYVNSNAGVTATTQRMVPISAAPDPLLGISASAAGRWDNMLSLIQSVATPGDVQFRVVQVAGGLQFQCFQGEDLSGTIKFGLGLRNLALWSYEYSAPEANYVYVGGAGTGAARLIKEYGDNASIATWGRIEGDFVDRNDTSDATQLQQAGTEALTNGQEQASLSITPLETPTQLYGIHYTLGDKVTVQLEGTARNPYNTTGQIVDRLRSVEINLTPDGPVTITPTIGNGVRNDLLRMFRKMRQFNKRLSQQERS